ncbi:MAG TPA: antibiotic biosynthesis monooxygenase [Candidatus Sulfotelmatobacter sp.]|nr:antibiotic biosynthesis monooxygenase [Candidatus Sulfotelmatobacter sp.]
MFARILEFVPKTEKKDEFINMLRQEVLPILRKQPGFLELMPFDPEVKNQAYIVMSLWNDRRDIEKYEREVFPKVEPIVKPFLSTPITVRVFRVETTLCKHLLDSLVQAA